MKLIVTILYLVLFTVPAESQKYMTKTGYIGFYSHTPVEDIRADNNQAASVIDFSTGDIIFQVLIRSFHFPKATMEEHFNENYLESEKYPRAVFKGKILNHQAIDLSKNGTYEVTVEGELNMHNVTRKISARGEIITADGQVSGKSKFTIKPEDYNITIPSVVRNNIAKEIEVTVDFKYTRVDDK